MPATIGAAIDYLVTGLLPLAQAVDVNVEVADNLPKESTESVIVIGRESQEDPTAGQVATAYGGLGALRMTEEYTINGFVYAERQGPDQKPARDAAIGLLEVVTRFVHTDNTLGGILQDGRIAFQSASTLQQTDDPTSTSGQVWAQIGFTLSAQNSYLF